MAERTIKVAFFRYRTPYLVDGEQVTDDKGKPVYLEATARMGETVDIPLDADVKLGESHGLFVTDAPAITEMSAAELRRWLTDDTPSVPDVVAAVGGDPALAKRVLAAERTVTKDEPRASLVDQLERVTETA